MRGSSPVLSRGIAEQRGGGGGQAAVLANTGRGRRCNATIIRYFRLIMNDHLIMSLNDDLTQPETLVQNATGGTNPKQSKP